MPITAPKPENNYTLCPKGTHVARIFKIVNLGTHDYEYKGESKTAQFVRIYWELPNKLDKFSYKDKETGEEKEVEKPFAVSREFTLSMGPKSNLRPIVEGVIGTSLTDDEAYAYDLEDLLGRASLITVVHKKSADGSREFAVVSSTAELMEGQTCPDAVNSPIIIDANTITEEACGELPEWLRDKITESHEWKKRFTPKSAVEAAQEITPEDSPF